jgi:hypothetical protein
VRRAWRFLGGTQRKHIDIEADLGGAFGQFRVGNGEGDRP